MVTEAMDTPTRRASSRTLIRRVGAPPIPHEHGAWVMLYLPMLLALGVAGPDSWTPVALLAVALAGAFLARHPADLLLRKKGDSGSLFWTLAYGTTAVVAVLPLLFVWHATGLLPVAAIAAAMFGIHAAMLVLPSAKRLDRTIAGEVLAALGLTLSAPAVTALTHPGSNGLGWLLWLACALFFGSGIFHVKMMLAGAKHKGELNAASRRKIVRASVVYHIFLAHVALGTAAMVSQRPAFIALAFMPVVVRALWGAARLSKRLPSLKRVGMTESAYAVWFAVWFGAAMLFR